MDQSKEGDGRVDKGFREFGFAEHEVIFTKYD